jgi:hypothetical protein
MDGIKKVVLTLAPLPLCIAPLLLKPRAARASLAAPFKLIPWHQIVFLINRRFCTHVGSFLFGVIAVEIEIVKEGIVLCDH